jgi:DNA replication protein DnaC
MSVKDQEKIYKFLEAPKHFLLYCGNPGIGKTHFCASLTAWAMKNFTSWRYWDESQLLKRVRSSMEDFKGDYLQTLKLLIDDPLIIIDDIGSTGLNEWREEIFFDLLDERYNTMEPTVLTSNFSVAEFKKLYHPRICSRLFSAENTIVEILDGVDMRTLGK